MGPDAWRAATGAPALKPLSMAEKSMTAAGSSGCAIADGPASAPLQSSWRGPVAARDVEPEAEDVPVRWRGRDAGRFLAPGVAGFCAPGAAWSGARGITEAGLGAEMFTVGILQLESQRSEIPFSIG